MSKKIILIAGPTASGKSKLAIKIANKIKGEIINADSMQVYKEFSVLSSRPVKQDLKKDKAIEIAKSLEVQKDIESVKVLREVFDPEEGTSKESTVYTPGRLWR